MLPDLLRQQVASSITAARIPGDWDADLRRFLEQARSLTPERDILVKRLWEEYESNERVMLQRYLPKNVGEDFVKATEELLLHMNTTKIAVRAFQGVYSGTQTRHVTGKGPFVDELEKFVNSPEYQAAIEAHYLISILTGTSIATPYVDQADEDLDLLIHHPVQTHIFTDPANVKDTQAVVEFDPRGYWLRFVTKVSSGIIYSDRLPEPEECAFYSTPLPYVLSSIAYGEDRRALGNQYGGSLVKETPGYNRILTNCYYCLGLLIKWQSKSLLTITGNDGGESALPKKMRRILGTTALLMEKDGKAQFISPDAKFGDILAVVNSYLSFLAVLLGIPKTAFQPQDNVSAQSARLEGAPLLGSMRKLGGQFERHESDIVLRAAALLHISRLGQILKLADLKKLYKVACSIVPWDWTDDVNTNAQNLVLLVNSGIVSLRNAIKKANPTMTPEEIDQAIIDRQHQAQAQLEAALAATNPQPQTDPAAQPQPAPKASTPRKQAQKQAP